MFWRPYNNWNIFQILGGLPGPECGRINGSPGYTNNWKYKHTFLPFEEGHPISTPWSLLKTISQLAFYLSSGHFLVHRQKRDRLFAKIILIASKPVSNRVPAVLWNLIREALFCTDSQYLCLPCGKLKWTVKICLNNSTVFPIQSLPPSSKEIGDSSQKLLHSLQYQFIYQSHFCYCRKIPWPKTTQGIQFFTLW